MDKTGLVTLISPPHKKKGNRIKGSGKKKKKRGGGGRKGVVEKGQVNTSIILCTQSINQSFPKKRGFFSFPLSYLVPILYSILSYLLPYPLCHNLSYPNLPYHNLSYPILSYPILSYPTISYLILSYPMGYHLTSIPTVSYRVISCRIVSYSGRYYGLQ